MQVCCAVLVAPQDNAVISIASAIARVSGPWSPARRAVLSQLGDGTFLATGGDVLQFNPVPGVKVFRYPGAAAAELLERHQQHLAGADAPPLPVENAAQAEEVVIAVKRHQFDWRVRTGVWVPLTREELEELGLPVDE